MKKIDSAIAAFAGDDGKKKSKKTRKLDLPDVVEPAQSFSKITGVPKNKDGEMSKLSASPMSISHSLSFSSQRH